MVRRSFRLGLRVGLVAGVVAALVKVLLLRRSSGEDAAAGAPSWPPLPPEPVTVEPPAPTVPDRIAPVTKAAATTIDAPPVAPASPPESPLREAGAGVEPAAAEEGAAAVPDIAAAPAGVESDVESESPSDAETAERGDQWTFEEPAAESPAAPVPPSDGPAGSSAASGTWAPTPGATAAPSEHGPAGVPDIGDTVSVGTGPDADDGGGPVGGAPETPAGRPEPGATALDGTPDAAAAPAGAEVDPGTAAAKPATQRVRKRAPASRVVPMPVAPPEEGEPPSTAGGVRRVRKAGARRVRVVEPWVEATGKDCPATHPVKAKLASMLYHLPGMAAYDRTRPDRCYPDAESAESDGFIKAKR